MSETNKDELIAAQNQVIGMLFEIIKRLQANNDLDEEYFQIIENKKRPIDKKHLDEIMQKRTENSKIVATLLKKLEV
jgi:hypothetical protein